MLPQPFLMWGYHLRMPARHLARPRRHCGPAWPLGKAMRAGTFLQGANFCIADIKRLCEGFMHRHGVVPFDKMNVVAMTLDELMNVAILFTPEHSRAGNLVAIQVENGQHGPVAHRIQKLA